jgi:hypothetical protein
MLRNQDNTFARSDKPPSPELFSCVRLRANQVFRHNSVEI